MTDKRGPEDDELKNLMGSYFQNATRVTGEKFQPQRPPPPKNPAEVIATPEPAGTTGRGTPPPFPIVPTTEISKYQESKQTDADTFGLNQSGKFDPELNALALKEVAESRGMTVDELLKTQADRKSSVKLEPAQEEIRKTTTMDEQLQAPQPPRSFLDPEQEEIETMEERLAQAKQRQYEKLQAEQAAKTPKNAKDLEQRLKEQDKRRKKKKEEKEREEKKLGIPKEMHDNPVIERLRKKLGLDEMEPAVVEIEGITFEMLPPPSSLNLWILEKIQAGQIVAGDGAPLALTIKIATVSAAIVKIEGERVESIFSIPEAGDDELSNRMLVAQSLWEMFLGLPSRQELFRLHPDVPLKLYEAFKAKFENHNLKSSFDPELHRYVCPIDGCTEMYDMSPPASGLPPFCKVHGVPMDDKGTIAELRSVPLA